MELDSLQQQRSKDRRPNSHSSKLREFFRRLGNGEREGAATDTVSRLDENIAVREVALQIPGLNLRNDDEEDRHDEDRDQAEVHATENLARPLIMTTEGHSTKEHSAHRLSLLSEILACNLNDSFHILLEARLRAYANILARHGLNLATTDGLDQHELDAGLVDVEHKLHTLAALRESVKLSHLCTHFDLLDRDKVQLNVAIKVFVPSLPDGKDEVLIVKAESSGHFSATFQPETNLLTSLRLTLDTQELLHGLVGAASRVSSCCLAHLKDCSLQGSKSHSQSQTVKEEIGSSAAKEVPPGRKQPMARPSSQTDPLPVVSPEFGPRPHTLPSKPADFSLAMPFLALKKDADIAVDELSTEKCEMIVDQVIGSVNDDMLLSPANKKQKTGH